MREVPWS